MRTLLRSGLFALWTILAASLVAILKETFWAALTDWIIKKLGYPAGAEMVASLAGVAIPVIVAGGAIYGAYWLGRKERELSRPPDLKILFDPQNPKYIGGTFLKIGLRNNSRNGQSLFDISLKADNGPFAEQVIFETHPDSRRDRIIFKCAVLHAGATEYVDLFGIAGDSPLPLLAHKQRFVLEASARDTPIDRAEFEYDHHGQPQLRRISS